MADAPMRILLTGPPGCGKTTAVARIVAALSGKVRMAGFYTEEIREAGRRVGFRWQRLDGRTGTLAHVHTKSPHRVSKYGVDVESFETQAVSILDPHATGVDLFVIDEIGKMECFSARFVEAIHLLLKSDKSVLATVAQKGTGLIREVKSHPHIELVHLTRENRDEMTRKIIATLSPRPTTRGSH
jgi:nucleoside-triphosphatase